MVTIPSRSRLLSTALRRDLALKRYGRGANLVAMTGLPSKAPSRKISPMILSEAPLPYISAVSTRVTPSTMLVRKASPTSLRWYSLPYPQSLVVPQAQAPIPRGAMFSSSARPIESSLCKASPLIPSPRYLGERGVSARSRGGMLLEAAPNHHYDQTKTLSENFSMKLEEGRISPRMRLPISPSSKEMRLMREATTPSSVDYFNLPRPLWRKLKKCLPRKRKRKGTKGGRPRASDRAVINAICYVLWTGCQWKALHRDWFGVSASVVHERFQRWRGAGIFEKLRRRMVEYYARERGGIGWKWQAMDSKHSPAPLG